MKKEFKGIIITTAKDYDMDPEIVQNIYDKDYENFYENLEEYIKIRSRIN